jgi:hypothetical protein
MMFEDNTLISVGPDTDMQIADYQWHPDKKAGAMKTRVSEGVFRIMGGAITRVSPDNFNTETPAGTIGIRGSMYAGKVSGSSLHLLFQGGKGIFVTNAAGSVSIDRPGFGTFVAGPNTAPTAPVRFTNEDLEQLGDVIAVRPETSDEDDGTDKGKESQSTVGESSRFDVGEDEQPLQEQWGPEATDEQTADEQEPLLVDGIDKLQSVAFGNPVDAVTNVVNEAVVDSIQSVRQDEVLEIERKILELLEEMGFSGDRSVTFPKNGIEGFDGLVRHKSVDSLLYAESPSKMVVNWHNQKFFSVVGDENQTDNKFPVFIFGDVNGTTLDNVWVIGSSFDPVENWVSTINGTGTFGQLYGNDTEAAGFAMEGVDVNVQNQSHRQDWTAYGAVINKDNSSSQMTAPTGTHTLSGFVIGVAEDMTAPEINRRIFTNNRAADFQLSINKDAGTISGSLTAHDAKGSDRGINNLQIGGSLPSAYVLDDAMIALLGGADSMTTAGSSGELKEYGNYLVTRNQEVPMADYTTWGYWEIAYRDPDSGADYHVHGPGSYWIAGPQTPASEVNNLISANFIGTYTGGAQGIQIDAGGRISELTGGATNLTVDFNPSSTMPVQGMISFDQVNLGVTSTTGAVKADGFGAHINGSTSSTVTGAFFGPNAASVAGKFGANMSTGKDYYGIFAGSR